jgi:hypothetical protein
MVRVPTHREPTHPGEMLHEITLEKILDIYPEKEYPVVVKKSGESPEQYPDFDDDEYDEDEYE